MKIISKFKDYYDFVLPEPDNRKVFVRDTKTLTDKKEWADKWPDRYDYVNSVDPKTFNPEHYVHRLAYDDVNLRFNYIGSLFFCDHQYTFIYHDGVYYWSYESIPSELLNSFVYNYKKDNWSASVWKHSMALKRILKHKQLGLVVDKDNNPIYFDINKTYESPIVLLGENSFIRSPKLTDIGFNKLMKPEIVYQMIYNWIEYPEPELPSSPTDMYRYEGKGFDKKTSFRPNMK